MKVCDRCKGKLDTDKVSSIDGEKFELCKSCSKYISEHIKNYKKKSETGFGNIFN